MTLYQYRTCHGGYLWSPIAPAEVARYGYTFTGKTKVKGKVA